MGYDCTSSRGGWYGGEDRGYIIIIFTVVSITLKCHYLLPLLNSSALQYASGQREAAERRMVERQEMQKAAWIDVQFLKQAAEQVCGCGCDGNILGWIR